MWLKQMKFPMLSETLKSKEELHLVMDHKETQMLEGKRHQRKEIRKCALHFPGYYMKASKVPQR
jgi:hypothetical protein